MKTKFYLFTILTFLLLSCSSKLKILENGKRIDESLVGTWVGSEKDKQIEGAEKSWEMIRRLDGTFTLDFKFKMNGKIQQHKENGSWWIENGKFHELHDVSGKTDIYKYKVLDENRIKFISQQISVEMNNENYEFIDTRK